MNLTYGSSELILLLISIFFCLKEISSSNNDKLNFLQYLHENLPPTVKNRHHHQRNHHLRLNNISSSDITITDPLEGLTASVMQKVNGLHNSDVTFLIISSWFENGRLFRERVIPAMRTWMRLAANVFIILEDTVDARLAFRHCHHNQHDSITAFHCPNEPIILMSRICTDNPSTSDGICCKVDELIRYLTIFRKELYIHTKYVLFADDDSYFRVDTVLRWLSYIEHANISHIPLVANDNIGETDTDGCKDIESYGWYGQSMMNKAAMDKYISVPTQYPITEVCKAWEFAQDVAMGVFSWMLELNQIYLPGYKSIDLDIREEKRTISDHSYYLDSSMIFHHVFASENNGYYPCDTSKWPSSLRYSQEDMVGCGSLYSDLPNTPLSHRGLSSYDLWKYFAVNGTDEVSFGPGKRRYIITKDKEPIPRLLKLPGYNVTDHYRLYHPTSRRDSESSKEVLAYPTPWRVFARSDCKSFYPPK